MGHVAELAGVTVRTLHHYDEIGLVRPSARTAAGYRVYSAGDVERLRETYSVWFFAMYDKQNLYLLAKWKDEIVIPVRK